jgi:predicted adenine nucleotide alpha hydrolase (AANH) superfamily ATPase
MRIEKAAQIASKGNFDAFTTTLMYSRWQDHDMMKEFCEIASKKFKIAFHYEDYREGWQEGIDTSKERGMYRQQYCGCIYSEEDRYRKQLSKYFAEGRSVFL